MGPLHRRDGKRVMRSVVILGGHGDGLVAAAALLEAERSGRPVRVAGFLNDATPVGGAIGGIPVLGRLEDWSTLSSDVLFLPALHKAKLMHERARRICGLGIPEERWATVVHPMSVVSESARVGSGSFVGPFVTIQPGAQLGRFVSLRAGANVGHDARCGDFSYMGPNATLCGRAELGEGSHLGPNAVVLDGKRIGNYAVVGIGSAVTKNLPEFGVYMGNPARRVAAISPGGLDVVAPF
jgi:acetyltransferase EpsM